MSRKFGHFNLSFHGPIARTNISQQLHTWQPIFRSSRSTVYPIKVWLGLRSNECGKWRRQGRLGRLWIWTELLYSQLKKNFARHAADLQCQVSSVVSFRRTVGALLLGGEYSISFPPFLYTSLGTYLDCFSMGDLGIFRSFFAQSLSRFLYSSLEHGRDVFLYKEKMSKNPTD